MWDAQTDPLGIGLQSRAANKRMTFAQQNPGTSFGPGHSAAWDGFFQAMQEKGVTRLGDSSTKPGFGPQFGALPSTFNPRFQTSAVESMPSNQIGTPGLASMKGLMDATKRGATSKPKGTK